MAKKRYQVSLMPSIAEQLRAHGDGSISRGIARYQAENKQLAADILKQHKALLDALASMPE